MTPRRKLIQTFAEILFAMQVDSVVAKNGHSKDGAFFNDYLEQRPHIKRAWAEVNKDLTQMHKDYITHHGNSIKTQQKGTQ